MATPPRRVFLVSGGTGHTARYVLQAALKQFEGGVRTRSFPHTPEDDLEDIFRQAAAEDALVLWTLVGREARDQALAHARQYKVRHVDALGPLLDQLELYLEEAPRGQAGLLHRADDSYFARIAAIEFTLAADDGRNSDRLRDADIVIVGVSRTGKTPLSTYLAHRGYRVGNQPLALELDPPRVLFDLDPRRVFGLLIDPAVLQRIRSARMRTMRVTSTSSYDEMGHILAELEEAEKLYRRGGWHVIDVTNRAIEESAASILQRLEEDGLLDEPVRTL